MRLWPIAVSVLACSTSAFSQISVREDATRAHLVDGKTAISLGLRNTASQPLDAIILLQWFGPTDERHGFERRAVPLQPGESFVAIPLPLSSKHDPLLERLQYEIDPGNHNYTAFSPVKGVLSFANIADYAFSLGVVFTGLPRAGKPYEIRMLTSHPLTGKPVAGAEVSSANSSADLGQGRRGSIARSQESGGRRRGLGGSGYRAFGRL